MHVVVAQTILRKCIQIRRLAGSTEATDLPEAHVIENDEQNVGRAFFSPQRPRPRRRRNIERSPNHARERSSWFVFFERHKKSSLSKINRINVQKYKSTSVENSKTNV
jgi:hypothetical protein